MGAADSTVQVAGQGKVEPERAEVRHEEDDMPRSASASQEHLRSRKHMHADRVGE